jgi:hypothetical protein
MRRAHLGPGTGLAGVLGLVGLVGLVGLTGCPAPHDYTPLIHVDPRAAQRLGWFARQAVPDEPAPAAAARVHPMRAGEELHGPAASGRPGDWVLENAEVVFVIAQASAEADAGEGGGSAGSLLDAADAQRRQDELGLLTLALGTTDAAGAAGEKSLYDAVASGTEPDGTAWVQASRPARDGRSLAVTTRYTLHPPDRALLVATELENAGEVPIELSSIGDGIVWGTTEKVAPGKSRGFQGASSGAYVGGVGRFASYALTSTEGNVEAVSGDSWTRTAQHTKVTLAAHARTTYERVLVVGARADTSSLVAELAMAAGLPVGAVKLIVGDAHPGTQIELTPEGATEALTMAAPFEGVLPLGRYRVAPLPLPLPLPLDAGAAPPALPVLDVKAEGTAELTVRAR